MANSWQEILGTTESHLVTIEDSCHKAFQVHEQVASPLNALLEQAQSDGILIAVVSSFRSFDQQLNIWNQKWLGHRPVYSRHGRPLNMNAMSDMEKYKAICLWSALPSMSRHHWGTDLDIFDARSIENGHKVELVPEEFSTNGPCSELELWLQQNLNKFDFFRPYAKFQGGVSHEPWHISYRPTARQILNDFQLSDCHHLIEKSNIQSKQFILNQLNHYYETYFCNICEEPSCEKTECEKSGCGKQE